MFDRAIFHIKDDIKTIYEKDPAANNILEVIFVVLFKFIII